MTDRRTDPFAAARASARTSQSADFFQNRNPNRAVSTEVADRTATLVLDLLRIIRTSTSTASLGAGRAARIVEQLRETGRLDRVDVEQLASLVDEHASAIPEPPSFVSSPIPISSGHSGPSAPLTIAQSQTLDKLRDVRFDKLTASDFEQLARMADQTKGTPDESIVLGVWNPIRERAAETTNDTNRKLAESFGAREITKPLLDLSSKILTSALIDGTDFADVDQKHRRYPAQDETRSRVEAVMTEAVDPVRYPIDVGFGNADQNSGEGVSSGLARGRARAVERNQSFDVPA